jgi:hypothetical protein
MLQLLIILAETKSNGYIRSVIMQILIILHQKNHNLPTWKILDKSLSLFNEEAGEMSFSVLSRCVLGDTIKHKLDYMNNMYSSIHFMQEVDLEMREDNGKKFTQDHNFRHSFSEDSPEVSATKEFILSRIRLAIHGDLRQYDGTQKGYTSAVSSANHQTVFIRKVPLWDLNVGEMLDKHIAKTKDIFINTNFGQRHVFYWPEMKLNFDHFPRRFVPDDDLDSESGSSDSDSECSQDKGYSIDDNGDNNDHDNDSDVRNENEKIGANLYYSEDDNDCEYNASEIESLHPPPTQSPKYGMNNFARQSSDVSSSFDNTKNHRVCDNVISTHGKEDESVDSESEISDSTQGAGGGGRNETQLRRTSSQSPTSPVIDRVSWKAANQANMNTNNIISSSKKRFRKQINYGEDFINSKRMSDDNESDSDSD